jgi:hypothetical protein
MELLLGSFMQPSRRLLPLPLCAALAGNRARKQSRSFGKEVGIPWSWSWMIET